MQRLTISLRKEDFHNTPQPSDYSWYWPTWAEHEAGSIIVLQLARNFIHVKRHDEVAIGCCGTLFPPIKFEPVGLSLGVGAYHTFKLNKDQQGYFVLMNKKVMDTFKWSHDSHQLRVNLLDWSTTAFHNRFKGEKNGDRS